MKKISEIIKNRNLFVLLIIFLPFIDLITALETRFLNISLTLGIVVKGLIMIYIFYYLVFVCKLKERKLSIYYIISLIIFSIIYLVTKIDGWSFRYLINEIIYLFKFSFFPILVIGLILMNKEKKFELNEISSVLPYTFFIYVIFIFIPYFTKTGFKSYGLLDISNGTVGWYYAANEIGAIIILLFTFVYNLLEKEKYFLFMIFSMIGSFSAFLIGTKVASLGVLIIEVIMIFYYLIYNTKFKLKKLILTIIVFCFGILSFRVGPTVDNVNDSYSRYEINDDEHDNVYIEPNNKITSFAISLLSGREVWAIRVYRVYDKASIVDKLFGIGFSNRDSLKSKYAGRLIEMDFLDMLFRFGIVGFIIFVIPVVFISFNILKCLIKRKISVNIDFLKYFVICLMVIAISFIAGHVIGSPAVSFYLGLLILFIYCSVFQEKNNKFKGDSKMKVSILMPTYNDCDSICKTFDSIKNQIFKNWELIVIDDGSTDDTYNVIFKYKKKNKLENKIKYIKQENKDQLFALINGSNYITGDYVYILHSDDLFASDDALLKATNFVELNPSYDGILPNILIINENDEVVSKQRLLKFKQSEKNIAIDLLWLGRNLYSDFPFIKKEVFLNQVRENYLTWNRPFWLNINNDNVSMLNMINVDFCLLKYRVYEGNYANNEVGLMCLINGELRCATSLMKFFDIPFFKLQYFIFRCVVHLHLFSIYRPIYFRRETKNKSELISFIIKKRYPNGYDNKFFSSLVSFYESKSNRTISFNNLYCDKDPIYEGNSLRLFNKQIVSNTLPKTYENFLEEMEKGFRVIKCKKKDREKLEKILKFLCIYYFVEIKES